MNQVNLTGRLARDPELKRTQTGKSTTQFYLAVNRVYKQEGQKDVDFINCVAWNKQAENLCTYCHKGDRIGIVGRLQEETYKGNDGQTKYITRVIVNELEFLSKSSSNNQSQYNQNHQQQNQQYQSYTQANEWNADDISSDELPF